MLGLIRNAVKGSIDAKFYTDSWPHFSSLICEQISPKLSEVAMLHMSTIIITWSSFQTNSIMCYTTCEKTLCDVLVEGNALVRTEEQLIQGILCQINA